MGATDLTLQPVRAPDPDRPGEEVLHSQSQLARLQPDGVVVHEAKRRIVLLEFTRPNDGWDDALWQAAARKDEKYRLPPVRISTEYGSDFKGADGGPLSGADVTQHNERYSE